MNAEEELAAKAFRDSERIRVNGLYYTGFITHEEWKTLRDGIDDDYLIAALGIEK